MKDKIFGVLQRVGRSFMLPIAILPVAGLLLGIGGSFTNETMLKTYGLWRIMGPGTVFNAVFEVMKQSGDIVFANLPILFAMGVAIGMAKREKEVAVLAAAVAFFVMHASISAMIAINGGTENMLSGSTGSVVGIVSLQMGVFGGMIVGLGTAALHNRFHRIQLPQVLSFFGGSRFVPIISALVFTAVGILMFYVWPPIQQGIYLVGSVVQSSGYAGTWVYGLMERLLIPFGLHHVFYMPFWQTAVGGTMEVGGVLVEGAQNIFFAQLADPTVEKFAVSATRFMSGKFPLMIFGLPGAALAMYKTAQKEKQKLAGGLLLSAALTSMLTGITEPIEFTFLFVAPILYGIHCVLAGAAYMLMHIFQVGVGMTFSGGLIDMFLFGVLQGNAKTNWIWIVIVGVGYFVVYYFLFKLIIVKLDLKTPGRDDNEEVKLYHRKDVDNKKKEGASSDRAGWEISSKICIGLGGKANISDVDCCATRLRCTVHDPKLVEEAVLKATGTSGVVFKGNGVQVIYGPHVTVIKSDLEEYLETEPDLSSAIPETKESEAKESETRESKAKESGAKESKAKKSEAKEPETKESKTRESEARKSETKESETRESKAKESEARKSETKEPKAKESDRGFVKGQSVVKTVILSSPITGVAARLEEAPDQVFAEKMLGDGGTIAPTDEIVVAPEDGEISFIFDTKHAIGFVTESGISMLIHIGIDTVTLDGEGFEVLAEAGQKVKKNTPLLKLNLDYLKEKAASIVSPIICTELKENQKVRLLKEGKVTKGETFLAVDFYQ